MFVDANGRPKRFVDTPGPGVDSLAWPAKTVRIAQEHCDNHTLIVHGWVEGHPGAWTARLCRLINDLPESEESIIHCGRCKDYANPAKRRRAARYAARSTLLGFDPPYQLLSPATLRCITSVGAFPTLL